MVDGWVGVYACLWVICICVVLCGGCCFAVWFVLVFCWLRLGTGLGVAGSVAGYWFSVWVSLYFCFGCVLLFAAGRVGYGACGELILWLRLVLDVILWFIGFGFDWFLLLDLEFVLGCLLTCDWLRVLRVCCCVW